MGVISSCRPFRAQRDCGRYLGLCRVGSTLGYNPAAASRLLRHRLFHSPSALDHVPGTETNHALQRRAISPIDVVQPDGDRHPCRPTHL